MKKVVRLTESDLIGIVKKVLLEQTEGSYESCSVNLSKDAGNNVWKNMNPGKREEKIKEIKSKIEQTVRKSVQEYITWFSNPLTQKKFKTVSEQAVLAKIPSFLKNINKINLTFESPSNSKNARAWTYQNDLHTINYNLSHIHDGNDFVGQSIEYTTKHEMGHLIDFFLKQNGVKTYNQTINTDTPESYNQNYIVNDKDQYSRLNVLRGIIDAGPADDPKTLLSKFLKQVKLRKITSNKFNFSGIISSKTSKKNDTENANKIMKFLSNSIFVGGRTNINIEQLFSNFALNKGGTIYVNFNLISELNITSKDMKPKYYFLKLSPK